MAYRNGIIFRRHTPIPDGRRLLRINDPGISTDCNAVGCIFGGTGCYHVRFRPNGNRSLRISSGTLTESRRFLTGCHSRFPKGRRTLRRRLRLIADGHSALAVCYRTHTDSDGQATGRRRAGFFVLFFCPGGVMPTADGNRAFICRTGIISNGDRRIVLCRSSAPKRRRIRPLRIREIPVRRRIIAVIDRISEIRREPMIAGRRPVIRIIIHNGRTGAAFDTRHRESDLIGRRRSARILIVVDRERPVLHRVILILDQILLQSLQICARRRICADNGRPADILADFIVERAAGNKTRIRRRHTRHRFIRDCRQRLIIVVLNVRRIPD